MLLASSIAAVVITHKRSANPKFTSAFSLAVLGFTYWIEVFLLLVFDAYTYYPMLTPWYPFQDAVLGNIFSQVSVSTTAVLCCVLKLRGFYILIFSVAYFLIDVLFSQLNIYRHYWYRSVYTLIGFPIYCLIIKMWYETLTRPARGTPMVLKAARAFRWIKAHLHMITLSFAVFAAAGNLVITTQKVAGLQIFRSAFFDDMSKNHTLATFIYAPAMVLIMLLITRWKRSSAFKVSALFALFLGHWLLLKVGILSVYRGWFVFASTIDIVGFYLGTVTLDRLLSSAFFPGYEQN
jgi:hypothetical protein